MGKTTRQCLWHIVSCELMDPCLLFCLLERKETASPHVCFFVNDNMGFLLSFRLFVKLWMLERKVTVSLISMSFSTTIDVSF